ncbi:MAG: beta-glucosidase BglX [Bacteroidales bacterium]|nr:beta-glucosidase BglX [Bacteroidales bacterium]
MKKNLILGAIISLSITSCMKSNQNIPEADNFVDSLMGEMTIEEKIGQLTLYTSTWAVTGPTLNENYEKDILSGKCGNLFNALTVEYNRKYQKMAVEETRLGIPLLFGYDVIHGYRTIFPIPLAEACSWDSSMVEQTARLSAVEAAAGGINWTFAPVVDLSRDPRWGRIAEGSGEDPYLGSVMARAKVRGIQGENLSDSSTIAACIKHFAAYGAPEAGRDYNTVDISERTFREYYLPPYKAAVEAGAQTAMTSFNELFDVPASGSEYLLRDILRDELGFKGVVVTDYSSISEMIKHGYAKDRKHSGELAIRAGVDMDMQSGVYQDYLAELIEEGTIDIKLIDEAVRRILLLKYNLGLFENPYRYLDTEKEEEITLSADLLEHSYQSALRSIVLLKNEKYKTDKLLPLKKDYKSIAIIGPLAENKVDLMGSWHGSGSAADVVSLKEGISAEFPNATVKTALGSDFYGTDVSGFKSAVQLAKESDIVLLTVGENFVQSGEAASRSDICLPAMQQQLVEEIAKTGKPVVAIVFAGRPLDISWMDENLTAIIYAWQPGTMAGKAVADILSGDYNPSAKLVVSFPRNVGQIPIYYNAKNTGRPFNANDKFTSKYIDVSNEPLYPFGYGISYTEFEYSEIVLDSDKMAFNGSLKASISVSNIGKVKGEEIVQLYIRDLVGSVTRPVLELKAFQKISLEPGEKKELEFILKENDLRFWNIDMKHVAEAGDFKLFIGPDSKNLKETGFVLEGK